MEDFIKCIPLVIWVLSLIAIPVLLICAIWGIDTGLFIKLLMTDGVIIVISTIICQICCGD